MSSVNLLFRKPCSEGVQIFRRCCVREPGDKAETVPALGLPFSAASPLAPGSLHSSRGRLESWLDPHPQQKAVEPGRPAVGQQDKSGPNSKDTATVDAPAHCLTRQSTGVMWYVLASSPPCEEHSTAGTSGAQDWTCRPVGPRGSWVPAPTPRLTKVILFT